MSKLKSVEKIQRENIKDAFTDVDNVFSIDLNREENVHLLERLILGGMPLQKIR